MKALKHRRISVAFLALILLWGLALSVVSRAQEQVVFSVSLTVFFDGYVYLEYSVEAEATEPVVNLTLLGTLCEDVVVVDGNTLPLDYSLRGSEITIYSLGAKTIAISYHTQDLTRKNGRFWTLEANVTGNTTILLPTDASVLDMNRMPDIIEESEGHIRLVMSPGFIQITYVVGVIGTKEHAQVVLDEASTTINKIKALGVIITTAEMKLQEAYAAFSNGSYANAEALGLDATKLAVQTNNTAAEAKARIADAENAIAKAKNEGRTSGLDEAENLLGQARSAYTGGQYSLSSLRASESSQLAAQAQKPFPFALLGLGLASAAVILGALVYRGRRASAVEPSKEVRVFDAQRIIDEHSLRKEEVDAVQFLAQNNGQAFEAELFKHLDMPRTSMWRMIRRLEDMGVVKTAKVRRQNVVTIEKRYEVTP